MNRLYILKLTARMVAVLIVLALLLSASPVLAAKDKRAPTAPTNLHTTAITHTSVTLAWNPSTDNSGSVSYRVHMVSPLSFSMVATQTSLTWTSLSPNATYSFYVYAIDKSGNQSPKSNTLTVTTPADTTPPTAPVLSGSVLGPSQVSLTWTAATDENQWWSLTYAVWVNGNPAAHVNWYGERSVRIRHLTPATTYVFTVQAWDISGNRTTSNQVTLTTEASSDTVAPTAPTNLHLVSDQGGGEFYLGWTQSTDDVDPQYAIEYEIYVNGVLSPLAVSAGVDQDFVYAAPECENVFVVKAVDQTGNTSEPSNELTLFPWGPCP
ncbi:MAG: fibronectin type III domain-containing protein [Chloroflexi bacterium]|nr:fibronectin type III domain-containing protein [Chloroflexota bacterium]